MMTLIGVLIALGILVTVHEGGHFLAARCFGVAIEKFSIGFGPKLVAFSRRGTEYRISLLPLGGYLKMKGENPDEKTADADAFIAKKWWQRAVIAFAGPFANLLLAMVIITFSFVIGREFVDNYPIVGSIVTADSLQIQQGDEILAVNGQRVTGWSEIGMQLRKSEPASFTLRRNGAELTFVDSLFTLSLWKEQGVLPYAPAVIGNVSPGLPAYKAGLLSGDKILSVNGILVENWYDMREKIISTPGTEVTLEIERDGTQFSKTLKMEENVLEDQRIIGITQTLPIKSREAYPPWMSLKIGSMATVRMVGAYYTTIYQLIKKPSTIGSNIGGPIMMYEMSRQSAKGGIDTIFWYFAAISIMLAVVNLLPIPVLDGGQIFFLCIEGIRGRPLPQKAQFAFQNIGLFIILFLMVYGFFSDFSRVFERASNVRQQSRLLQE